MTEEIAMVDQEGYRIHRWGGELQWESFSRPEPARDEVLIHVEACGIGLTVLNCMAGNLTDDPALLPRVPGHELVGTVTEAGPGAGARLIGKRVVAYFYLTCGTCAACVAGRDPQCSHLGGWVGTNRDGGYAPWAVLPAHNAIAVPDGLDPVLATVAPDAVATPVHVCNTRAKVTPQDRVAVIGAGGGVGIHMVQVAQLLGARVAGLDIDEDKLAAIEELGVLPVQSSDFGILGADLWPEGPPTVVIDLLGSADSLEWSRQSLDMGGRMVILTTFPGRSMAVDPRAMVFSEVTLLGSRYARRSEVALAAELIATGRIRPIIGASVGPDEVPKVHDELRKGSLLGRGAVVWDYTATSQI